MKNLIRCSKLKSKRLSARIKVCTRYEMCGQWWHMSDDVPLEF